MKYNLKGTLSKCGLIAGCCLFTSCMFSSEKSYEELGGGFFIKTTAHVPGIDAAAGRELHYRDSHGKDLLVWKHLTGKAYAHDGFAVFVGWRETSDGARGDAYLAAKGGGPIVSLAKSVLTQTAKQKSNPPEDNLKRYSVYELRELDDSLEFEFVAQGVNQPHLKVRLSWHDVIEMTQTLINTGTLKNDKVSGKNILE